MFAKWPKIKGAGGLIFVNWPKIKGVGRARPAALRSFWGFSGFRRLEGKLPVFQGVLVCIGAGLDFRAAFRPAANRPPLITPHPAPVKEPGGHRSHRPAPKVPDSNVAREREAVKKYFQHRGRVRTPPPERSGVAQTSPGADWQRGWFLAAGRRPNPRAGTPAPWRLPGLRGRARSPGPFAEGCGREVRIQFFLALQGRTPVYGGSGTCCYGLRGDDQQRGTQAGAALRAGHRRRGGQSSSSHQPSSMKGQNPNCNRQTAPGGNKVVRGGYLGFPRQNAPCYG
jgi:hypothetical protein